MAQNKNLARPQPKGFHGPRGGGEKAKNLKAGIVRLLKYLKPFIPAIIVSVLLAAGGTFLNIFAPKHLTKLTTLLSTGVFEMNEVAEVCLWYLFLIVIAFGINVVQHWIMAGINTKICRKLRGEISEKINKLPLSYFDKNTYGDILSRITNDVDTISFNLNNSVTTLITSIVSIVCVPIFMFSISWQLTMVALASVPVTIILTLIVMRFSHKHFRTQQTALGAVNGQIEEIYSAQLIVKVFNGQKKENAKFDQINQTLYKSAYKSQFIGGLMQPIMKVVTNLSYVLCCVLGAVLIINGTYPALSFIGEISIFLIYIRQFNNPLQQLSTISSNIQSTIAASERVFEFLDEPEQADESAKNNQIVNLRGNIEFKNVKFGYTADKTIIHDLSFEAKSGNKIAIVGPTGAGKTTIVNLLMRFYDVDSGSILIDGTDTQSMKREAVRSLFAMVLQDTWLFDGTIRENLKYGNPDATDEKIIEACKASNVWHFITTLPNGLDYQINEKSSLSAGQKQLFTIARAMIQNAPMLILDEATSSVDTRTEELIQDAMDKLTKGKTSFVIAHRLSTIKNADLILLLKNGDVVEQGTHEELLAKNGEYAELYNSQFLLDNPVEE